MGDIVKIEFYYDKTRSDKTKINSIIKLLEKQKQSGNEVCLIDISNLSKAEIFELYTKAWAPSVFKKYKIRTVFGSHRNPGTDFGKVPALLVYEKGSVYAVDVFPHDKHGKLETIENFLEKLE